MTRFHKFFGLKKVNVVMQIGKYVHTYIVEKPQFRNDEILLSLEKKFVKPIDVVI